MWWVLNKVIYNDFSSKCFGSSNQSRVQAENSHQTKGYTALRFQINFLHILHKLNLGVSCFIRIKKLRRIHSSKLFLTITISFTFSRYQLLLMDFGIKPLFKSIISHLLFNYIGKHSNSLSPFPYPWNIFLISKPVKHHLVFRFRRPNST